VGWSDCDCDLGTLLKKDVMGLYIARGLPGDFAGDFLGDSFASPHATFAALSRVPLLGRRAGGGGVFDASSSESESTTGFFLGLTIPPRLG
jgi:hypothetical protein